MIAGKHLINNINSFLKEMQQLVALRLSRRSHVYII